MNIYTPNGTSHVPVKYIDKEIFNEKIHTSDKEFTQAKMFFSQTDMNDMLFEIGFQMTDKVINDFVESYDNKNNEYKRKGINTIGRLCDNSMSADKEEYNPDQIKTVFNLSLQEK